MINFPASTFTWKAQPRQPHPYYLYDGGFVGEPGAVYHVRFSIEAKCDVRDDATGHTSELFVGHPCRSEYTIADRNLLTVPSTEFRLAFSRERTLKIADRPSTDEDDTSLADELLAERYQDHRIDIRRHKGATELTTAGEVIEATLANDMLSARSSYTDERGISVSVEFPVDLINIDEEGGKFQVCTGPVVLPDLATWDGTDVRRVFLAEVALSSFDYVEFILRRAVEPAESELEWLQEVRGRDRNQLADPDKVPPGHPPRRWRIHVYNEVWAFPATNVLFRAENG